MEGVSSSLAFVLPTHTPWNIFPWGSVSGSVCFVSQFYSVSCISSRISVSVCFVSQFYSISCISSRISHISLSVNRSPPHFPELLWMFLHFCMLSFIGIWGTVFLGLISILPCKPSSLSCNQEFLTSVFRNFHGHVSGVRPTRAQELAGCGLWAGSSLPAGFVKPCELRVVFIFLQDWSKVKSVSCHVKIWKSDFSIHTKLDCSPAVLLLSALPLSAFTLRRLRCVVAPVPTARKV